MNPSIGMVLLALVVLLCVLGLYHSWYQDNLGHCVGMVLILLWAFSTLDRTMSMRYLPASDAVLCAGLICFGTGTAVRVWLFNRKKDPRHAAQ